MAHVRLFPDTQIGRIKPVHGVGQPPFSGGFLGFNFSMFSRLTEAGIPFSRLHDVQGYYGGFRFVDVPNIFRDFDADPDLPENYDFVWTDLLMRELEKAGVEPFFRLGVTIENQANIKAYFIYPPKDPMKWARICEHIIRHYTEGWADGYHMKVNYWEIWNEPDNPNDEKNMMWKGTPEEYFNLYDVAAKHLKACFPHLKIGGYAGCGFYALTWDPTAPEYPAQVFRREFFDKFLAYIKKTGAPLDFYSFHCYDPAENAKIHFDFVRRRLDEEGYTATEISMNEWNPYAETKGTAFHAAQCAAFLLAMQNGPVDTGMFYDARFGTSTYGGLFSPLDRSNFLAYYDFCMFNELYRLGTQIGVSCDDASLEVCGAKGADGRVALMIVNRGKENVALTVEGMKHDRYAKLIAKGKEYVNIRFPEEIRGESVLLLTGVCKTEK